ncbi:hypothetical protein BHE74_00019104 [Ensete ventricosum]|nr:hypothetical protein GW17_00036214 [Ensete ventricosum]RWW73043.1 hypothetical protein BHE74_00019104 [Ensete ventricosum]
MSLIPGGSRFGSRRSNAFNIFFLDLGDRCDGIPFDTHIDWKETPEAHVFKADVPGLTTEDVKVEVEDGRILQISGEWDSEEAATTDFWHCVERRRGRFLRRFWLPETARLDQTRAVIEDGLLTVTLGVDPSPQSKTWRDGEHDTSPYSTRFSFPLASASPETSRRIFISSMRAVLLLFAFSVTAGEEAMGDEREAVFGDRSKLRV